MIIRYGEIKHRHGDTTSTWTIDDEHRALMLRRMYRWLRCAGASTWTVRVALIEAIGAGRYAATFDPPADRSM